ncbi:LamG domain-containing protein [Streptomyces sp. NPDC058674]|uniref:LamG domain-containing protein n=1 Tax=Streptomyces sp. NPDC058674 TaxID=3346592 RepID=UPI00366056D1
MTDGTNPPSNPQPEQPAPGSGGYGFPPGPPAAGGGYGYPPGRPVRPEPEGFGPPAGAPPAPGGGYGYPAGQGEPNPYQQDPGQAPVLPNPYQPDPGGAPVQPNPYQQGGYQQFPGGTPGGPGEPWPPAGAAQPAPFVPRQSGQPDWEALADRSAAERRRKRIWAVGGAVTALLLLAGGGTFLLLGGDDGGEEVAQEGPVVTASVSPEPSGSKSKAPVDKSPTVASDPSLIRDHGGKAHLKMSAEAGVFAIDKHYELRTKGNEKSYAESEKRIVDTSKSFTVSARIWNRSPKGRQIAVSQGNDRTFAFELGSDEVNGKPAWIFRVQTGEQGADSTAQTVVAEGLKMEKTMTTLTGTYDDAKKTITLYVNGKKRSEAQVTGVFSAPGPLQLGRSRHEGNWTGAWNGAMDSLRTFGAELSPTQVDAVRQNKLSSVKPTGSWLLF